MKFKKGEVYCGLLNTTQRFIWDCRDEGTFNCTYYLYTSDGFEWKFAKYNAKHGWSNNRLATPQEKEHLQQCIQAGKYVDYVESKLTFNYLIL